MFVLFLFLLCVSYFGGFTVSRLSFLCPSHQQSPSSFSVFFYEAFYLHIHNAHTVHQPLIFTSSFIDISIDRLISSSSCFYPENYSFFFLPFLSSCLIFLPHAFVCLLSVRAGVTLTATQLLFIVTVCLTGLSPTVCALAFGSSH